MKNDIEPEYEFHEYLKIAPDEFQLGEYHSALANTNKAIDINSNSADAYHIRGSIKHSIGDVSGACKDWKKSVKLGGEANHLLTKYCEVTSNNISDSMKLDDSIIDLITKSPELEDALISGNKDKIHEALGKDSSLFETLMEEMTYVDNQAEKYFNRACRFCRINPT